MWLKENAVDSIVIYSDIINLLSIVPFLPGL